MKNYKFLALMLVSVFGLVGCRSGRNPKSCDHIDLNSDHVCDLCGENLPFIDSPEIIKAGYKFNTAFPEELIKQFLGSQEVFKPSTSFTKKGAYYGYNQENTTMTIIYGVDVKDDSLMLLSKEMHSCDNLFYFDEDNVSNPFGSKNDLYTVACSFINVAGANYLTNVYSKNNALYKDTKLTENNDWTNEDKDIIGDRLPFFKMGEGYKVEYFPETDSDVEHILISDNYAKYSLKEDIASVLTKNGFYYVPSTKNYQKPSDVYDAYAYTVDITFYYGTKVRLTKQQCASKTFQSKLVQESVLDQIKFKGEVFYMDLSTKEYLGEQIAPEYRASIGEDYVTISGIYANFNEFIELQNKYLNAGYKIINKSGDDSRVSIEFLYLDLTVILEIHAKIFKDDSSNKMINDFDHSTLSLTFKFTTFTEFPSISISQYFAGKTNVNIPAIEGQNYYFLTGDDIAFVLVYSEDFSTSYYEWVQVLLKDEWVIDEVDHILTDGEYLISCYKDNLMIGVGFMYDSQGNVFIDLEIFINETGTSAKYSKEWPEEDINNVSLGRTNVQLPAINDPDNMMCYGFIQNSALEYSVFGYGLIYAEDYAGMLEADGFVGGYDEDNSCFVYTKGNLTVKIYEGYYHFRVDVTISL